VFDKRLGRAESSTKDSEAAIITEASPVVSDSADISTPPSTTLSNHAVQILDFNPEHDAFGDQINLFGDSEFANSTQISSPQRPLRNEGPDLSQSLDMDRVCNGNLFSTMNHASSSPPKDQDSFMTLFNSNFNNGSTFSGIACPWDEEVNFSVGKDIQFPHIPSPTSLSFPTPNSSLSCQTALNRHFTKNAVKTGIQRICATMIIDMIYAYPHMMTRRETLPPFIHAYYPISDDSELQKDLPKHITNCMAIFQLFAVRTSDTHPFIWSTIRAEMRSLRDGASQFNTYEAMSALQACLMYLIIRVVDDKPQDARDDWEMLLTHFVSFPICTLSKYHVQ
jgi:hypothetical protein